MTKPFQAPWWIRSGHLQTLWPTLTRSPPPIPFERERFWLSDGDFIDLDWAGDPHSRKLSVVLHGLGGSSRSTYASGIAKALSDAGWRVVVMHLRGCSGEPNHLDRSYHSGDTGDVSQVIAAVRERDPERPVVCVGFSLGGNMLLKWLGECGTDAPVIGAVAVSVPFQLDRAADALNTGFARVYQWYLVRTLVNSLRSKFSARPAPADVDINVGTLSSFWIFDDRVTAPLHGFEDVFDYYAQSSSRQYLHAITVPTLLLQSKDDPFLPVDGLPSEDQLSDAVKLELSERGGHVGFVEGASPLSPSYWLERRIPDYFDELITRH